MTNPKPEPVAWMYEQDGCYTQFRLLRLTDTHGAKWTETPLYPASALDEAYRRGQEDMRERAAEVTTQRHREWQSAIKAGLKKLAVSSAHAHAAAVENELATSRIRALEPKP